VTLCSHCQLQERLAPGTGGIWILRNLSATILLIERDADLRTLSDQLLNHLGYTVSQLPEGNDPVALAEQIGPQVIVIGIRPEFPEDRQVVDDLLGNFVTRAIPVVAISFSEEEAITLAALPNVSQIVIAPFRITALETAVARAVGRALANDGPPEHLTGIRLSPERS